MIANRMKVHDPEVGLAEPMDASNASGYLDAATLDGVPGRSITGSDIDKMNEIMALMEEDLRRGALWSAREDVRFM